MAPLARSAEPPESERAMPTWANPCGRLRLDHHWLRMPGLDGCEAARRIRELPWGKSVTLVALTRWDRDDIRALAEEAGFDRYFVKPVDHVMLLELLARHRRPSASL